ncbi:protein DVR-1-like [Carassius carassius]|uniref:protein DVR-1-like n=1 Tax=Carassius carassius TaxID=217509 RepID=UPI0028688565|nr:protein DVR-1-like [Carassius carassius]
MLVLEDVEQLSFAQLEMKLKQDLAHLGPHVFSVDLCRVLRTTLKGVTQESSRNLLLSQWLGPGAHASVHVNLTDLAETWKKPGKNYGMHVELQHTCLSTMIQEHAYEESTHSHLQIARMPELCTSLVVVSLNPFQ